MSRVNSREALSWGLLESFVVIIYLSSALFFIPGTQSYRAANRALPFASSPMLLFIIGQSDRVTDRRYNRTINWLNAILILLGVGILLPFSNRVIGMAQLVFRLSIAAPFFWMRNHHPSERRIERIVYIILLCNGASATLGILQAYDPERYMPPEMTSLGQILDQNLIASLSYKRADGTLIVRPPGLTDMPGGSASGAGLSVIFGIAVAFRPGTSILWRSIGLGLTFIGMFCLYLTGVRS